MKLAVKLCATVVFLMWSLSAPTQARTSNGCWAGGLALDCCGSILAWWCSDYYECVADEDPSDGGTCVPTGTEFCDQFQNQTQEWWTENFCPSNSEFGAAYCVNDPDYHGEGYLEVYCIPLN